MNHEIWINSKSTIWIFKHIFLFSCFLTWPGPGLDHREMSGQSRRGGCGRGWCGTRVRGSGSWTRTRSICVTRVMSEDTVRTHWGEMESPVRASGPWHWLERIKRVPGVWPESAMKKSKLRSALQRTYVAEKTVSLSVTIAVIDCSTHFLFD